MSTKVCEQSSLVVIVGSGSIGRRHFEVARQNKTVNTVLIGTRQAADFRVVDRQLIFDRWKPEFEVLLDCNPLAVVIATPATTHFQFMEKCIDNGINFLVEKPMLTKIEEAYHLKKMIGDRLIVARVGYNLRHSESLNYYRRICNSEGLGRILAVQASVGSFLPDWRNQIPFSETVSARRELGGGVLFELSHELDYLNWIFGPLHVVTSHISETGSLGISVEDVADVILGSSLHAQLTVNVHLDFLRRDTVRECSAIFEGGTVIWDGVANSVRLFKPATGWTSWYSSEPIVRTYQYQFEEFLSACRDSKVDCRSLDDSIDVVELISQVQGSESKSDGF